MPYLYKDTIKITKMGTGRGLEEDFIRSSVAGNVTNNHFCSLFSLRLMLPSPGATFS